LLFVVALAMVIAAAYRAGTGAKARLYIRNHKIGIINNKKNKERL